MRVSTKSVLLALFAGLWACGESDTSDVATQASASSATTRGGTPTVTVREATSKSGMHSVKPATALEAADRMAPPLPPSPDSLGQGPAPIFAPLNGDVGQSASGAEAVEASGAAKLSPAQIEAAPAAKAAPVEAAQPEPAEAEEDMNAALEALGYME